MEVTDSTVRGFLWGDGGGGWGVEEEGIIAFAEGGTHPLLHSLHQETREVTTPKQNPRPQGDRRDQFGS